MGIFTRKTSDSGIGFEPFSDVLEEEEVRHSHEDGDHERFAHFVRKEKIVESAVTGKAVQGFTHYP